LTSATDPPGLSPQLPVFVYGTLRPGEKNYPRYLAGRTLAELPGTVAGELFFVADGGYPYLSTGEGRVQGEMMVLAPQHYAATLSRLDALEEYDPQDEANSVYLRRSAKVLLADGSERLAWVYYWNLAVVQGKRIVSGDFRDRSKG
jgi:gamma-glutamylcyclotransferase (GGCT)/AIG2-like uncharacterized protein YtfP